MVPMTILGSAVSSGEEEHGRGGGHLGVVHGLEVSAGNGRSCWDRV